MLVRRALKEDGDKVFAISPAPDERTIWDKLVLAWSYFDSGIGGRYHSICQEVQEAQATLRQKTKDIDDEKCVSEAQKTNQEACDEALKLRKACRQKKTKLSLSYKSLVGRLGSKDSEIDRKKRTISTRQAELKGLSKVHEDLEAQIVMLEAKAAPDGDYFVQLTKEVQAFKQSGLDLKEQELFQITEQFEILAQSRDILKIIRQEIADIPARIEACKATIKQYEQDLARLVEEHSGLKKQLDDLQQEQAGLDQEYLRLDRVHSKAHKVLLDHSEAFNRSKEMRKAELQSQYEALVQRQLDEMEKLLLSDQVVSFSTSVSKETGLTRVCCKRTTAFSDGRVVV